MYIYDFDFPERWVGRFAGIIAPIAESIQTEILDQSKWDRAGMDVRISVPEPTSPNKDSALAVIHRDFTENAFRAFHATRLVESEAILDAGLRKLNREEQVRHVLAAVEASNAPHSRDRAIAWKGWSKDVNDSETIFREGDCWLTPSRYYLHDGGLDLMFSRFGGEFIERISGDPFQQDAFAEPDIGRPTVVVAALPTKWCYNAPEMGPRRILYEVMASVGFPVPETFAGFWDVQVGQDIPPSCIEYVCCPADVRVAAPCALS